MLGYKYVIKVSWDILEENEEFLIRLERGYLGKKRLRVSSLKVKERCWVFKIRSCIEKLEQKLLRCKCPLGSSILFNTIVFLLISGKGGYCSFKVYTDTQKL